VLSRAFDLEPDHSAGPVREQMTFTSFPTNLGVRLHRRAG
jgi:hypothetical protein